MRQLLIAMLLCLPSLGCGQTYMLYVPESPFPGADSVAETRESDPRVECEFMTVMIDYSRSGMGLSPADVKIASRVADAMSTEFESYGTHVTDVRNDAYWSLMILASNNERHDGYIFSALLTARNMNEGQGPGLAAYGSDEDESDEEISDLIKIPSMYNGLSYGPYTNLEDRAREYVRQAYNAVFPAARQLCDFEAADTAREADLESQLPALPQPL
jgi:hypothetical protein